MRSILPALLLLAPALHAAENAAPSGKNSLNSLSLLPVGSELKGVMLPRYDKDQHLVGVLKAKGMTLVSEQAIAGESISIEFFNPDRSPRGHVDLVRAMFNQTKGTLEAREPVTIQSDQIKARGTGLVYAFEEGEGFLSGPATTWTRTDTYKTTMNSKNSSLRAAGLAGAALVSQTVSAQTPPDTAATAAQHSTAVTDARAELAASLAASNAANASAKAFLEKAELIDRNPPKDPEPAEAKPLDIQPGPKDTIISCDGGMYFNPDEGVFVYLKNVRVADPGFTMTGANDLKIFLEKFTPEQIKKTQEEKAAKAKAAGRETRPDQGRKEDEPGFSEKFGDPERIIATGAILIEQKAANGKEPIKASGGSFSYNIKADQAIITGRYPWLIQQGVCLRAKQPDLTIRFSPKAGTAVADPGEWETILNLEQLQKKPK